MRKQSQAQITGREGERWFESVLPPTWSIQRPIEDFGLDGIVAVGDTAHITPYEFGVQIKSSAKFNIVAGKVVVPKISKEVLLYWGRKFFPTLLVAYDTRERVGYFEWVPNLVSQRDIETAKKTFYLHIPLNRRVTPSCWDVVSAELQAFHREFTQALLGARQIVPLASNLSAFLRNLCGSQLADLNDRDQEVMFMCVQGWTHLEVVKEIDSFIVQVGSASPASNKLDLFRAAYVKLCRQLYHNFDDLYNNPSASNWIMMKKPPEAVPLLNELLAMLSDCVSGLLHHLEVSGRSDESAGMQKAAPDGVRPT